MAYKHLSSVECISIEKRGFIPNRYYVYVLIVEWSDGDKHPIYRKYSSFYDFEKMLHDRIGHKSSIPELPAMNILQKAFKIEKNHISEINEFCMSILRLSEDIVRSVVVSSFFEAWATDFPMEDSSVENRLPAKKKDAKKKLPVDSSNKNSSEPLTEPIIPSAPPAEEIFVSAQNLSEFRPRSDSADDDLQVQVYVCTMNYHPDSPRELSLVQGMKCIVLERNDDGWWFIMRESDGHQGYAPATFLVPSSPRQSIESIYSEIPPLLNNNNDVEAVAMQDPILTAKALCCYEAKSKDEISYAEGEELHVLDMNNSGWWKVRCHGKVGLVPAVHLQLASSSVTRTSTVFMRNNSLYARKPPPRRQHTLKNIDSASVKELVDSTKSDIVEDTDPGYATVTDEMAGRRVLAPSNKAKSEGVINYAELVFDEAERKRVIKPSSNGGVKKADTVIYTQIIPRNGRKADEPAPSPSSSPVGKRFERGKAIKKFGAKPEEGESGRKTPSPPGTPPMTSLGRVSPVPLKPRAPRSQEPTRNYENHTLARSTANTSAANGSAANSLTVNGDTNNEGLAYMSLSSCKSQAVSDTDYLRRSSIEPPLPPAIEAPTPTSSSINLTPSIESYTPAVSTIQAKLSYDGPNISGMLMFAKGDTAMLMSKLKGSDNGWWYVNLRGFEGYVPGAYWEPVPSKTAPSPATRHRTPQPVPRTHSPVPPPCQPITSIVTTVATTTASTVSTTSAPLIERNSMESELWYHGKMSRPQSEKKLSNFGNGVFLIRESVNRVGDLTLSVKWEGKVRHFPIEAKEGNFYNIGKHDFKTLHAVISHYSKHPLFYSESNDPVKLKSAATKT